MPEVVRHIVLFVTDHLDTPFTLETLGRAVRRSPAYINVLFHQWTGMTIHEYAMSIRMAEAAYAIERGVKIEAVAVALGYRSRQTFYRHFRACYGAVPSELRAADRARMSRPH